MTVDQISQTAKSSFCWLKMSTTAFIFNTEIPIVLIAQSSFVSIMNVCDNTDFQGISSNWAKVDEPTVRGSPKPMILFLIQVLREIREEGSMFIIVLLSI